MPRSNKGLIWIIAIILLVVAIKQGAFLGSMINFGIDQSACSLGNTIGDNDFFAQGFSVPKYSEVDKGDVYVKYQAGEGTHYYRAEIQKGSSATGPNGQVVCGWPSSKSNTDLTYLWVGSPQGYNMYKNNQFPEKCYLSPGVDYFLVVRPYGDTFGFDQPYVFCSVGSPIGGAKLWEYDGSSWTHLSDDLIYTIGYTPVGNVSGQVVDFWSCTPGPCQPVAGATVDFYQPASGPGGTLIKRVTTDVNGNYVADNLPEGMYYGEAWKLYWTTQGETNINVVAGSNTNANFALETILGALEGNTYLCDKTDCSGSVLNLSGATIYAYRTGTNILEGTTTSDSVGYWKISNLPPVYAYDVNASHPSYAFSGFRTTGAGVPAGGTGNGGDMVFYNIVTPPPSGGGGGGTPTQPVVQQPIYTEEQVEGIKLPLINTINQQEGVIKSLSESYNALATKFNNLSQQNKWLWLIILLGLIYLGYKEWKKRRK